MNINILPNTTHRRNTGASVRLNLGWVRSGLAATGERKTISFSNKLRCLVVEAASKTKEP